MNAPKPPQPKEKSPFCNEIKEAVNFAESLKIAPNGQIKTANVTKGIDSKIYIELK